MAKTKYKQKYCHMLVEYFLKFIELRDDPEIGDAAERHGMTQIKIENGEATAERTPSTGYPTMTKFAIKIGVTPMTLRNWRAEFPEFDEACEFAEAIGNDVLDERALTGKCDGRVAMKIRELKQNAKRMQESGESGGAKLVVNLDADAEEAKIEIKKWVGEINEDTEY